MHTSILQLDILCSLSYFPIEKGYVGKTIYEIIESLTHRNNKKLKEVIYYNRLYSEKAEENIPRLLTKNSEISYPTFQDSYDKDNLKAILVLFEYIKQDEKLSKYRLVWLTDRQERFTDNPKKFFDRMTGHKSICLYNQEFNEYIFVIRGTNGSSQWFDNAKVVNKKMTASEIEAFEDFMLFYRSIRVTKDTKIILTGHSKGGLSALMVGVCLFNKNITHNICIHTMYAPFINKKRIKYLINGDVDKFMELVNSIEINVADFVSNLFIDRKLLENYVDKVYLVGDFSNNKLKMGENHEPLTNIVSNGEIIIARNYDKMGNPIKLKKFTTFNEIIEYISYRFVMEDIETTNPFIVAIFKKSGLVGKTVRNQIFDNDENLLIDFKENVWDTKKELRFSLDSIKTNKEQAFRIYRFIIELISDDVLQDLSIELFKDKAFLDDLFEDEVVVHFVSHFFVDFINVYRKIENKCCINMCYNEFEPEKVLEYLTIDILSTVLDEEFGKYFDKNKLNKLIKILEKFIDDDSLILKILKSIANIEKCKCSCRSGHNNVESEVKKEIFILLDNLFIVK